MTSSMNKIDSELNRSIEWKNELEAATKVRGAEETKKLQKFVQKTRFTLSICCSIWPSQLMSSIK